MQVKITATGHLKRIVGNEMTVEATEGSTLNDIKVLCGIKPNLVCGYTVNGKIAKGTDSVHDNDHVKLLMIVGAG